MDQHPIPQNVTGFQFKLIGAMTVKQFGYVAVGVIGAFIAYYLPIKGLLGVIIKAFLIPFLGASGAIAAFLPIDGRPIDVMAGNFFKALLSPNQYVYHKNDNKFSFSSFHAQKAVKPATEHPGSTPQQQMINSRGLALQKILITSAAKSIHNPQDAREAAFLKSLSTSAPGLTPTPLQPTPPHPISPISPNQINPSPQIPSPQVLLAKEEALKKQLEFAKKDESAQHDPKALAAIHQKTLDLEAQVQQIHSQKQMLEQEIVKLKSQLLTQKAPVITQVIRKPDAEIPKAVGHVRSVPKELNKKMGILVSDTPNVVSGMVKDSRNNVLPNILVEIKDKDNNPVRAFKTNTLGNFASATPLSSGTYTISLEDPKKLHTFDEINITANGQIMLPIEIISYDKREELRKELFS
ncbi:MAG TPA: PrgI family protein [Candidatus Limnocylindrales bacterium]|nr:PrgI family protein [Candidatus Limnocylindrales bacterium]